MLRFRRGFKLSDLEAFVHGRYGTGATFAALGRELGLSASYVSVVHQAALRKLAALRLRRPVSLCGEIAGNPLVVPLLMGMGLRSFSMNASAIPRTSSSCWNCWRKKKRTKKTSYCCSCWMN